MTRLGFLLLAAFVISACHDDSNVRSKEKASEIERTAAQGPWRVIYFEDSGGNATTNFRGYVFGFDPGNILTASNGSNNYPGSWTVADEQSASDEMEQDDIELTISFSNPSDFERLSHQWKVVSTSPNKLELQSTTERNGVIDRLTFEKL